MAQPLVAAPERAEYRKELAAVKEERAALVKKEDFDTRSRTFYDRLRVAEGYKTDIETIKERQEYELVNSPEYGLLSQANPEQTIETSAPGT